jgi:hypothetical protein
MAKQGFWKRLVSGSRRRWGTKITRRQARTRSLRAELLEPREMLSISCLDNEQLANYGRRPARARGIQDRSRCNGRGDPAGDRDG